MVDLIPKRSEEGEAVLFDGPIRNAAVTRDTTSYVDWPAIFGGAVLASAIGLLFLAFGSAIGLSFTSPYHQTGGGASWLFAIGAAVWMLWVQVSSFLAGGYLTGRLRRRHFDSVEHESVIRDGAHGLIVWAVGMLIATLITGAIGTGLVHAAGSAAGAAANVISESSGPNATSGYVVDSLFRPAAPAGATPATGAAIPAGPRYGAATDAGNAEVARILAVSAARGGSSGDVSPDDQHYIAQIVSDRTGMSETDSEHRVSDVLADARAKAKAAADTARKIAVISTFIAIASLLVGAVAAWWAATMGGRDRDAGTIFTLFGRWGYVRK